MALFRARADEIRINAKINSMLKEALAEQKNQASTKITESTPSNVKSSASIKRRTISRQNTNTPRKVNLREIWQKKEEMKAATKNEISEHQKKVKKANQANDFANRVTTVSAFNRAIERRKKIQAALELQYQNENLSKHRKCESHKTPNTQNRHSKIRKQNLKVSVSDTSGYSSRFINNRDEGTAIIFPGIPPKIPEHIHDDKTDKIELTHQSRPSRQILRPKTEQLTLCSVYANKNSRESLKVKHHCHSNDHQSKDQIVQNIRTKVRQSRPMRHTSPNPPRDSVKNDTKKRCQKSNTIAVTNCCSYEGMSKYRKRCLAKHARHRKPSLTRDIILENIWRSKCEINRYRNCNNDHEDEDDVCDSLSDIDEQDCDNDDLSCVYEECEKEQSIWEPADEECCSKGSVSECPSLDQNKPKIVYRNMDKNLSSGYTYSHVGIPQLRQGSAFCSNHVSLDSEYPPSLLYSYGRKPVNVCCHHCRKHITSIIILAPDNTKIRLPKWLIAIMLLVLISAAILHSTSDLLYRAYFACFGKIHNSNFEGESGQRIMLWLEFVFTLVVIFLLFILYVLGRALFDAYRQILHVCPECTAFGKILRS